MSFPGFVKERKMSVGERIREARKKAVMDQKELASKLEIPQSSVSKLETAAMLPSADVIVKLMQIFNLDANYFFQDDIPDGCNTVQRNEEGRITSKEDYMLSEFRSLPARSQDFIMGVMTLEKIRNSGEKG